MNQASAKASANSSGFSWKCLEIFLYSGSSRKAISAVVIIVGTLIDGSSASGARSSSLGLIACHTFAPAGVSTNSHSYPNSKSKYPLSHCVGFAVHAPSNPLVIVSLPLPEAYELVQPNPISSKLAPSGSTPTLVSGPAPCPLPKVCPPATKATVS